ncbi:MAG: SPFH domain-containing protein [Polyangia bacterium]|jgi:flotillin|nr:SPFH domain-containing protein [Polyangia bacterium]
MDALRSIGMTPFSVILIGVVVLVMLSGIILVVKRYRRCPSNKVLVIYGKVAGAQAAKCLHGGGKFIWPLIQDYAYLTLEPMTIDIELTGALSLKNIRVNVPSTVTVGISTEPDIMNNAAERLLNLRDQEIKDQARDIILGQMRLVIATMEIEEINQNRDKFLQKVNTNVESELNKIGLKVINVNVRDITDASGYIDAIGQKAAAEAINEAKVEVAEAQKKGEIGQVTAVRDKDVSVARLRAESAMGQKEAEKNQRIKVSSYEAEGVAGEAEARRLQEVAVAEQWAKAETGKKNAEREQRVAVAALEADAVGGENQSKASIADANAELARRQAEAKRTGDVALANANRDVLRAEKEAELAKLEKEQLAQIEVEKKKIEVEAEAEAERIRRIAKGEADGVLAKFRAEAEGTQKVLEAKAKGYLELLNACGTKKELAPTLLIIEKLTELVSEQVKAIQNLKIDKITVWDGGGSGSGGSTAGFLKGLIGSLPPMHELARQAGIDLPGVLGQVVDTQATQVASAPPPSAAAPRPRPPTSPAV